ncbi:MAG: ATP-dependent DNA ligase, partial [Bacteroidota bacterium]|nr:ATP-dependent DNA ligase [Bacteroidota bacterium]
GKKLKYIGHTGTGFTSAILRDVYATLRPLVRDTSPFSEKVSVNSPVTWVEPQVVCNIKYTEMTNEGILRHPVFMGLRIDKPAKEADHLDRKVGSGKRKAESTKRKAQSRKQKSKK